MKYYLYTFSDNWADEMDLEGFAILTETEKDIALAKIKKEYKRGGTLCFGTNEDNEYDTLQDIMNCIEFKEISAVEYNAIKKAFGGTCMGQLGPLEIYDLDEDDVETCEECGDDLEPGEDGLCEECEDEVESDKYEQEYEQMASVISNFIKKEYGLEETNSGDYHSQFVWKPTPKTQIEISISEFEDGNEEVELTLKLGSRDMRYDFLKVEDAFKNPDIHLKDLIKEFIEKAKKY